MSDAKKNDKLEALVAEMTRLYRRYSVGIATKVQVDRMEVIYNEVKAMREVSNG